ncbi:MAG: LysR family transcriptional regulator [Nitrospirae bacterium]|nr:LysR family transcriptional regulator [Candidatus Manganitrophaceae bacterium]
MELALLRIFKTITEEQSLSAAADRLNYAQSNISARLKVLETELDCSLFTRSKRGMFLTESGEKLLPHAVEMLEREAEIRSEMKRENLPGHVNLGVPDTFLRTYLAQVLDQWIKAHKGAKVRVKTGYSHEIVNDLTSRVIDIGVITGRERPKQFHLIKAFPDELCLVTPKNIGQKDLKKLGALQAMRLGDACFFGQAVMEISTKYGSGLQAQANLFSIESILQCIQVGLGYSVFPRSLIEKHPMTSGVAVHDYPGRKKFSYFKVCLHSRADSQLVRELSKYL